MRILVAISSCQSFEDSGLNNPLRETWLTDLAKIGWDYKFFHGVNAVPKDDVVVLNVVDELYGLTEKLKAKCRWAVEQGYDAIFSCFPDTYASAQRLLGIYTIPQDYMGNVHQFPGSASFCQGGPGYFVSQKACRIAASHTSSYLNDDAWLGDVLTGAGLFPRHIAEFTPFGPGPLRSNASITVHLSTQPGGFTAAGMYAEHKRWIESL